MAKTKTAVSKIKRKSSSSPMIIRRKKRRSKGVLGEMFSPTTAKNSIKATMAAFGGGLAARKASQLATTATDGKNPLIIQLALAGIGGMLMHSMLNAPNLASGFIGGIAAINSQQMGLGEDDAAFASEDALSGNDIYLDENTGEELVFNEDTGMFEIASDF